MTLDVPYEIGDPIIVDGKIEYVRGLHIFVTVDGKIKKYRIHIGGGRFVSINALEETPAK